MAKGKQPKRRRKLSESDIDLIAAYLPEVLAQSFFLPLTGGETHQRLQDDHDGNFRGELILMVGPDGDVWVTTDLHRGPTMRFRVPAIGGGQSPRTFNALRILALAIMLDNQQCPQLRHQPTTS